MLSFKRNLRLKEQVLRLCFAILAGAGTFYFLEHRLLQILASGVAATLAITACIGFCPAKLIVNKNQGGRL